MDDADLVARARAGDGNAFAALVAPHAAAAIRLAYALTGSTTLAEEATQEGFVRAYQSIARYDPGRPLRPWLLRVVANTAKNTRRAAQRRQRRHARVLALTPAPAAAPAEDDALAAVARDDVVAALSRLDERDRQVIVYRYFAGLSEAETAAAVGCPLGTVKSRHARAVRHLRAILGGEDRDG